MINLIINNKKVKAEKGETILEVARKNKIDIPALCFHPDLEIKGNCRICLVEIEGRKGLFPSCSIKVEEGMKVITESVKITRARKINLELIFSQHCEECYDCIWNFNCQIRELAKKYDLKITRFSDRKRGYPIYQFGPSLIFDSSTRAIYLVRIKISK